MATEADKAMMMAAATFRGAIVQAYAHAEFMLADLVMRARRLPEYHDPEAKFPFPFAARLTEVKKLLERSGPLRPYRENISPALDGMAEFEVYRHFMVHGLIVVTSAPEEQQAPIHFRLYHVPKGGVPQFGDMSTNLEQLEQLAIAIGTASNDIVGPIAQAVVDLQLEPA